MSDVALVWDADAMAADLVFDGADLETEAGLRTAVIVSLFTEARAAADDVLPSGDADRRGWWADAAAEIEGDRTGSRLWLLAREKQTTAVLVRARDYLAEALAWLLEDGVAAAVRVDAWYSRRGVLGFSVEIDRPTGAPGQRFDFVWDAL